VYTTVGWGVFLSPLARQQRYQHSTARSNRNTKPPTATPTANPNTLVVLDLLPLLLLVGEAVGDDVWTVEPV